MSVRTTKPWVGFVCASFIVMSGSVSAYEASRGPTELIYWDSDKASPGYTMVKPQRTQGVYLIDMAGQVVNHWPEFGDAYLQEDGTVLGTVGNRTFAIQDWEGNTLWSYPERREGYSPHHDFLRIYNAALEDYTILYIANAPLTHDEVIALGADPEAAERYDGAEMDVIVEVDRNGAVVWEWRYRDHLVQAIDPSKDNFVGRGRTIADYPGRLDINWGVVKADYIHTNGMDYNPETGHIALSSNAIHEIYVFDHDGTFVAGDPEESRRLAASEAGDFLYRFGGPAIYGQGDYPYYAKKNGWFREFSGHKQIGTNHDIQWIDEGLPGAGNLLLFSNGLYVPRAGGDGDPQSELIQINPYLDANGIDTGDYVNPPEAGYTDVMPGTKQSQGTLVTRLFSKQITWMHHSAGGFTSHNGSAVQRLPNGNTLAELARMGRLVEVTSEGEVVWEYVNPVSTAGIVKTLINSELDVHTSALVGFGGWSPMRWPVDFPGLAGKDLSPKGPITQFHSDENSRAAQEADVSREEAEY